MGNSPAVALACYVGTSNPPSHLRAMAGKAERGGIRTPDTCYSTPGLPAEARSAQEGLFAEARSAQEGLFAEAHSAQESRPH